MSVKILKTLDFEMKFERIEASLQNQDLKGYIEVSLEIKLD